MSSAPLIDGLQYANWSEGIFRQMRQGGLDAAHVTITYHETFRETVLNIERWNRWFERFPELILPGRSAADIRLAQETGARRSFSARRTRPASRTISAWSRSCIRWACTSCS